MPATTTLTLTNLSHPGSWPPDLTFRTLKLIIRHERRRSTLRRVAQTLRERVRTMRRVAQTLREKEETMRRVAQILRRRGRLCAEWPRP